jgi:hypothetical protein
VDVDEVVALLDVDEVISSPLPVTFTSTCWHSGASSLLAARGGRKGLIVGEL